MATELVRQGSGDIEVLQGWTPMALKEAIAREVEMRSIVLDYYRGCMQENHHFYRLTEDKSVKPALSKEGALNLCSLFKVTPMADPPIELYSPDGHYTVRYRVDIISKESGEVVARGDGLCTSRESKYAYRNAARVCPVCGKGAIIKGREEYGGGWLCYKKRDGCGAKFKEGDQAIESQTQGRVENEDKPDVYNTVLKMAEKRATVDAVLKLPLVSELFTQDLEESIQGRLLAQYGGEGSNVGHEEGEASTTVEHQSLVNPEDEHPTKEDMDTLQEYAKAAGVDEGEFWGQIKRMLDIPATEKITKKGIRDRMTMSQYEAADIEYRSRIKEEVEASVVTGEVVEPDASAQTAAMDDGGEDVADFHAPETPKDTTTTPERRPSQTAEQATTEPTGATNGHHALTAQYITELRALALPVSPKIYEEVQGIIQRNPGMPERVYTTTKAWLLAPKAQAEVSA